VALSELLEGGTEATWTEALVGTLAEQLQTGARAPEAAVALWRAHLIHRPGDEIRVRTAARPPVRGRFAGVTDAGHLRLEVDGAERVIATGDVVE
jgi:biotin-(acetyl-CoA carboxylase) ligase